MLYFCGISISALLLLLVQLACVSCQNHENRIIDVEFETNLNVSEEHPAKNMFQDNIECFESQSELSDELLSFFFPRSTLPDGEKLKIQMHFGNNISEDALKNIRVSIFYMKNKNHENFERLCVNFALESNDAGGIVACFDLELTNDKSRLSLYFPRNFGKKLQIRYVGASIGGQPVNLNYVPFKNEQVSQ